MTAHTRISSDGPKAPSSTSLNRIMLQSHPGNKFGYGFVSQHLAARFRSVPERADNILKPVLSQEQ
jgi:hypothetical protein